MIRIRPAEREDVPALAALAQRTWADAFGWSVTPEQLATDREERRSEAFFAGALRTRTTLVAEQDGTLVGYVQFGAADAEASEAHLHRLYVETALQGTGIGRALMEAALAHPDLAGAERVSLQVWHRNDRARRLYDRFGFHVAGTAPFRIGAEELDDELVLVREQRPARTA